MSIEDDALVLQVVDQVERRANERETKRFRVLYAVVGALSFLGIGVITQLVDFYATRAVDQRLEQSRSELETAKAFVQLNALATQIDMSRSFSNTDRDAIMKLLDQAKDNKKLRAEPVFDTLLQKIVRSFSASDNATFVSQIFDSFERECLRIPGIAEVLVQHYAKRLLSAIDPKASTFAADLRRFNLVADSAETLKMKAAASILRAFVVFRVNEHKGSPELSATIKSFESFSAKDRQQILEFVEQFSDAKQLSHRIGPDDLRIASAGSAFAQLYKEELAGVRKQLPATD